MRIDERLAADDEPLLLLRVLPAQDRPRASATCAARWPSCALEPGLRLGHLRRRRLNRPKAKTVDIVSAHQGRATASRRWRTSPASARPPRSCAGTLDRMREAGIENVLALRGDPPAGQDEWTADRGRPGATRASSIELIRGEYDFSIGAACFPETHIHASSAEADLRYLKEKVDAGARFLITQLFFDNAVYFDFVDRARATRHRRADRPRHHADHRTRPDQAHHRACAGRRSPPPAARARACAPTSRRPSPSSASRTRRCSAPSCSPSGAPGIHFYTLNRSPSTRAILGALRAMRARGVSASPPDPPAADLDLQRCASRGRTVGTAQATSTCRSGGRCRRPRRRGTSARAAASAPCASGRSKTSDATLHAVVHALLLAHAVDEHLEGRADARRQADIPARHDRNDDRCGLVGWSRSMADLRRDIPYTIRRSPGHGACA